MDELLKKTKEILSFDHFFDSSKKFFYHLLLDTKKEFFRIENVFKNILNDEEKKDLSNWWLQVILNATENFLLSKGFVENCTPFDYISNPPTNWEGVKKI